MGKHLIWARIDPRLPDWRSDALAHTLAGQLQINYFDRIYIPISYWQHGSQMAGYLRWRYFNGYSLRMSSMSCWSISIQVSTVSQVSLSYWIIAFTWHIFSSVVDVDGRPGRCLSLACTSIYERTTPHPRLFQGYYMSMHTQLFTMNGRGKQRL